MLVLSRKSGEKIIMGGGITIQVVEITGSRVRIGIEAPADVEILRAELYVAPRFAGEPEGAEVAARAC